MYIRKIMLASALVVASSVSAQFSKGDRMVGATIGSALYNSGKSEVSFAQFRGYDARSSSYNVQFSPTIGWFISDNTAVGGSLNINLNGQKITYKDLGTSFQEDQVSNFNIGLGGFIRNYFGEASSFRPFGQFGFNVGLNTGSSEGYKYYTGTPNYKTSYDGKTSGGFFANASLQGGFTKMVGERTGLDFYVGYNFNYNKNTYKTVTLTDLNIDGSIDTRSENEPTTKFTSHGVILGVGFQVFLGKK